jgi:hypothetical protein
VSEAYKESGNCRLEANYAHQQQVDMIPLMAQKGYQAKGWLGLILSTRLWYPFYGCEDEDDAKFEKRVDPVAGEIGERGKQRGKPGLSERVTPQSSRPNPEPKSKKPDLQPEPEPEPLPATPKPVAHTSTPDRSFSPSMQMSPQQLVMQQPHASTGASGSFAELSLFMEKQQALLLQQHKEAKQEARTDRAEQKQEMEAKLTQQKREMESKMEAQAAQAKADMDKLRDDMTPREQPPAVTVDELTTLQARLESLHAAQLLVDEELYAVEDLCADYAELQASVPEGGVLTKDAIYSAVGHSCATAVKLHKVVRLSSTMAADAAFARQLKRKFM